jgi:formylmethanofuran dehydrogenase subunit D
MSEPFILIPGRSARQGVTLNEGKYTDGYKKEIATLRMNPQDMEALQVQDGDTVRVWNEVGEFIAPCMNAKDELPRGMLFIAYGDLSCRVMPADTHGSGMPDSKGLDVFAEPAAHALASDNATAEHRPQEKVANAATQQGGQPAATAQPTAQSPQVVSDPVSRLPAQQPANVSRPASNRPTTPPEKEGTPANFATAIVVLIVLATLLMFAARSL